MWDHSIQLRTHLAAVSTFVQLALLLEPTSVPRGMSCRSRSSARALLDCWGVCVPVQALECFQKAHEAAGGSNADYVARIKTLKHKTGSQQKVAKVCCSALRPLYVAAAYWASVSARRQRQHTNTCMLKQLWRSKHLPTCALVTCWA